MELHSQRYTPLWGALCLLGERTHNQPSNDRIGNPVQMERETTRSRTKLYHQYSRTNTTPRNNIRNLTINKQAQSRFPTLFSEEKNKRKFANYPKENSQTSLASNPECLKRQLFLRNDLSPGYRATFSVTCFLFSRRSILGSVREARRGGN